MAHWKNGSVTVPYQVAVAANKAAATSRARNERIAQRDAIIAANAVTATIEQRAITDEHAIPAPAQKPESISAPAPVSGRDMFSFFKKKVSADSSPDNLSDADTVTPLAGNVKPSSVLGAM